MIDKRNLTGAWFGSFAYLDLPQPEVSFTATLDEVAGVLSGTTSELNTVGTSSPHLSAMVRGSRQGAEVTFRKTYDGASDAAHAIDYAGTVDEEGTRVAGFWQMTGASGSFEMRRTHARADEQTLATEVEQVLVDAMGRTA